ncbi:MAG: outer membrane beta-barrel protein [Candidatus Marinimicrobia bacterium]|nr:outer membrane beta-barrel protein [Candidatus Neomarinimicrobiota bacterium]
MKKMLITLMLMTGLFAQSNMTLIGGINYSTISGDDIDAAENLMGFRFGVQKNLENGLIGGLTYSQRGFSSSDEDSWYDDYSGDATMKMEMEFKVNYLTAYVLKPIPMQPGIDFLVGGELGYFMSGEMKMKVSYEDDYENYSESETTELDGDDWDDMDGNKLDYGLVFGGRYTINSQISIVGTYYFGLAELADEMDATNRSFQINLAYGL